MFRFRRSTVFAVAQRKVAGTFVAHLTFSFPFPGPNLALAHAERQRGRDGRQKAGRRRRRTLTLNNSSCENIEGGERETKLKWSGVDCL